MRRSEQSESALSFCVIAESCLETRFLTLKLHQFTRGHGRHIHATRQVSTFRSAHGQYFATGGRMPKQNVQLAGIQSPEMNLALPRSRHWFYTTFGLVVIAIVVIGFSRTYYLKAWFDASPSHGATAVAWFCPERLARAFHRAGASDSSASTHLTQAIGNCRRCTGWACCGNNLCCGV